MGRPRKLTPRQVGSRIDKYFRSITVTVPLYKDKEEEIPLLNDLGEQVYTKQYLEHPSLGKLAKYMGIHRETLLNYSKEPEYFDTIKRAREEIENYLEDKLYGNNVTGIIFNLKNNFGWRDKREIDMTVDKGLEDFFGDD